MGEHHAALEARIRQDIPVEIVERNDVERTEAFVQNRLEKYEPILNRLRSESGRTGEVTDSEWDHVSTISVDMDLNNLETMLTNVPMSDANDYFLKEVQRTRLAHQEFSLIQNPTEAQHEEFTRNFTVGSDTFFENMHQLNLQQVPNELRESFDQLYRRAKSGEIDIAQFRQESAEMARKFRNKDNHDG